MLWVKFLERFLERFLIEQMFGFEKSIIVRKFSKLQDNLMQLVIDYSIKNILIILKLNLFLIKKG